MKILIVCQFYYPEKFAITPIAEGLVKNGHQVDVVTGQPNYGYFKIAPGYKHVFAEDIHGVSVRRVRLIPRKKSRLSIVLNYLSYFISASLYLRKLSGDYDVVYSFTLSPVISVSPANKFAKKHHIKHLLHCVDLWPESTVVTGAVKRNGLIYKVLYRWSQSIYKKADHIALGSPSFKDYFHHVLHIDNKPFTVVVQPPLIASTNEEPVVYPAGTTNIVYCGNLGTLQNLDQMIGLARLLKKEQHIHLHIIGMGTRMDELKKVIHSEKLEEVITYHGPMSAEKSAAYYLHADALFVALKGNDWVGDTIPNKLIMYLAFARPIIAALHGDGADVVRAASGGILIDEKPQSLLKAIQQIQPLSQEEKKRLGQANRRYFDEHFSIEKTVQKLESILVTLVK